jgi:hypothetical protein
MAFRKRVDRARTAQDDAEIERAILADLRRKDRPGVRVIAASHGVAVNTVQRIAHAQ